MEEDIPFPQVVLGEEEHHSTPALPEVDMKQALEVGQEGTDILLHMGHGSPYHIQHGHCYASDHGGLQLLVNQHTHCGRNMTTYALHIRVLHTQLPQLGWRQLALRQDFHFRDGYVNGFHACPSYPSFFGVALHYQTQRIQLNRCKSHASIGCDSCVCVMALLAEADQGGHNNPQPGCDHRQDRRHTELVLEAGICH